MTHPNGEEFGFDPFRDGGLSYRSANFSIEKLLATANMNSHDPEVIAKRNFAAVLLAQYVNDIPGDVVTDDSFSQKETFNFHRVLTSLVELVCDDPEDQQSIFESVHHLLKVEASTPCVFIEDDYASTGLMAQRPYLQIYPEGELGALELGVNLHVADQFPGIPETIKIYNLFSVNLDPCEAGSSYKELFFGRDMLTAARAIALNTMYCPEADDDRTATLYHATQAIDAIVECGERMNLSPAECADLDLHKRIIHSADFNHRLAQSTRSKKINGATLRRCVKFDPLVAFTEPVQQFN